MIVYDSPVEDNKNPVVLRKIIACTMKLSTHLVV